MAAYLCLPVGDITLKLKSFILLDLWRIAVNWLLFLVILRPCLFASVALGDVMSRVTILLGPVPLLALTHVALVLS